MNLINVIHSILDDSSQELKPIVILISGQSNPQGASLYVDLPEDLKGSQAGRKVYFHNSGDTQTGGIDAENEDDFIWQNLNEGLARVVFNVFSAGANVMWYLADIFYPDRDVYFLHYCRNASGLNLWDLDHPAEFMYTESINYYNRGLAAIPEAYELGFMHFDQGENGGLTEEVLNRVISQYRGDYPNLKWIQRKLSVNQTNMDSGIRNTARDAVEAIVLTDSLFKIVDSDDIAFPDGLHYINAGAETVANRIFNEYNNF